VGVELLLRRQACTSRLQEPIDIGIDTDCEPPIAINPSRCAATNRLAMPIRLSRRQEQDALLSERAFDALQCG